MADSRAILDTSNALLALIKSAAETPGTPGTLNVPKGHISIESIDLLKDEIAKPHVTIFLFNIHENPLLKNQPRLVSPPKPRPGAVAPPTPQPVTIARPPMVLDLDYMICAWAAATSDEHEILGGILRLLYDHPELGPRELGEAWGEDEAVQLTLANPSIEEQARIWTTFGFKRFKLSLYYKARTVPIGSTLIERASTVIEREIKGKPEEHLPKDRDDEVDNTRDAGSGNASEESHG